MVENMSGQNGPSASSRKRKLIIDITKVPAVSQME
jgi:hypothetical protein